MKHYFATAVAIFCATVLAGCPRGGSTGSPTEKIGAVNGPQTIAIATLMTHPALDEVEKGLKDELASKGYKENIRYVKRSANGQVQLAAGIAKDLSAMKPDLIVAITTPMAQAVAKSAQSPIVFAAVTDPVGAKLVPSLSQSPSKITGTSDAWPYRSQLELIRKITPDARTIGVLFNPGEAASQYGMKQIRQLAPKMGFALIEGSVENTADVFRIAENLADRVDVLFLSSDNTVIGGAAGAIKVAFNKRKPLYVGDSGTVAKGGLAAASVGYNELGHRTGELVDQMLKGKRNIPTVV